MSEAEDFDQCGACGAQVLDIDVRCAACGMSLSSTGAQRLVGSVVLEQYVITDILGQGGMSVVYRGKHKITDQEVALKVLPPELAAYKEVKGRFLEEGRALAQLDHPNIVHLYNFGDDGDCLVLAMQYVRGDTWERMILEQESLPWRRTAELTRDVSNALDYAHGRGIIHRDMKPSNVLVRELDGAATVMDFGIAKMQSSSKLTADGQTMGTVRYMSPEQVRGVPVGVETDIYSLAMTAYESLVGDTPFTGETHFEIMTKHLNEAPVPPSKLGVDLPPTLEAVLMRAISKTPSDRQSSALEFKEQLQAVLEGNQPENIQLGGATQSLGANGKDAHAADTLQPGLDDPGAMPARRRGSSWMLVLAGLVLAAGAATFVITKKSEPKTATGTAISPANGAGLQSPKQQPSRTLTTTLTGAFVMPGVDFTVDESFEEESLRVLTTGEISAASAQAQVRKARQAFQTMAEEENLQPEDAIPLLLTVAVVPQLVMCNPDLYDRGVLLDQEGCGSLAGYYRPYERTLYLVADDKGEINDFPYWISYVQCVHSEKQEQCAEAVNRRFPKE